MKQDKQKKAYYRAKRLNKSRKGDNTLGELQRASKAYKKAISKEKAKERKKQISKLRNAKTKDPKYYWSVINRKNNIEVSQRPSLEQFYESFKKLAGANDGEQEGIRVTVPENNQVNEVAEEILNAEISKDEILKCIKNLKNGKANGVDKILNEYIKCTSEILMPVYMTLFNRVLNNGAIPENWTIGMILPLYKKGDQNDCDNYRGITLLSCLGKLFTSVLNDRLTKFSEATGLIEENQTGFRKGYSTIDHIFLMKNVIDMFLNKKKKLFCAFIDYRKAFDTVWRSALWKKMLSYGICGKIFKVITNMYNHIKSCIYLDNNNSEFFASHSGVRQGENLSPFLFALFVNDLEDYLIEKNCDPLMLTGEHDEIWLKLLVILYADDTALLAETPEKLQQGLTALRQYCDDWKLQLNSSKTKIVIFSRSKHNGTFNFN